MTVSFFDWSQSAIQTNFIKIDDLYLISYKVATKQSNFSEYISSLIFIWVIHTKKKLWQSTASEAEKRNGVLDQLQ